MFHPRQKGAITATDIEEASLPGRLEPHDLEGKDIPYPG
jgi:hypothetical protein